jgi:hypothetical protein
MTATLAPAVLTGAQRVLLAEAIEDAVTYRLPDGDCTACKTAPDRCGDHAGDFRKAVSFRILAADLGLDRTEMP